MKVSRRSLLSAMATTAVAAGFGSLAGAAPPYRIYMLLWRGPTEVETGFKDYLAEHNIPVELTVRSLERERSRIPGFVAEIRRLKPDLVYTWGTPTTLGVVGPYDAVDPARHITDIPVLFTMVSSPDGARVVPDFSSSRRNVTGVTHIVPLPTQIKAIQSYVTLKTLGSIYNPLEENSVAITGRLIDLGRKMGFSVLDLPVPLDGDGKPDPDALPGLVNKAAQARVDMLYIGPDTFIGVHRRRYTRLALEAGLPTFAAAELSIRSADALMGLVSRYYNVGRLTAFKAQQILVEGRNPADMPIETLKRFSLIIRMKVARRLGIYPPVSLLNYAEVIED